MHVPDHLLGPEVSTAAGAAAAAVVTAVVIVGRGSPRPSVGVVGATGAVVFAAQMVNYPVLPGTSGHLIGAALAVALLGPRAGFLVMTSTVVVQALLFGDGGVTALGVNVLLLAALPVLLATLILRALRPVGALAATAAAAFLTVPASAVLLAVLHAFGGLAAVDPWSFAASMTGVHLAIGLGEALVSAVVLGAVMLLAPGAAAVDSRPAAVNAAGRATGVLAVVSIVCAAFLSLIASASPDGLESVVHSYAIPIQSSVYAGAPGLAGYGEGSSLPASIVALVGTLVVAALAASASSAGRRGRHGVGRTTR